jgi:predicted S18 family serine protease
MRRVARRLALLMVLLSTSCAEPPHKEINQAQGAIDAARAAGADRFASAEFIAASDALKRSEEAVTAGDYRQALSHAIDSRERAQTAAKMAVEGRANARGQAERAIQEVATLLSRAEAELKDPDVARTNSRTLRAPRATIATAQKRLQEARSALAQEDYEAVGKALGSTAAELQAALSMIDTTAPPGGTRRKR